MTGKKQPANAGFFLKVHRQWMGRRRVGEHSNVYRNTRGVGLEVWGTIERLWARILKGNGPTSDRRRISSPFSRHAPNLQPAWPSSSIGVLFVQGQCYRPSAGLGAMWGLRMLSITQGKDLLATVSQVTNLLILDVNILHVLSFLHRWNIPPKTQLFETKPQRIYLVWQPICIERVPSLSEPRPSFSTTPPRQEYACLVYPNISGAPQEVRRG
ncbi:hypothetical protein BD779DRAFT_1467711 [Infundibulicybe gibba]|nr:hypothetical protein BD779DRAFT_1467711 [Infundibulicybe gibba]